MQQATLLCMLPLCGGSLQCAAHCCITPCCRCTPRRRHHCATAADVSSLSGPARDALPAAAADTQPPSPPSQLGVAIWPLDAASMLLKWGVLSRDDAAVAGYQLQLVRGPLPRFDEPSSAVTGYYGVMLGNTEMVLLEGLQRGVRYHARLRAADLGGRWSNWSVPRAFRLPT